MKSLESRVADLEAQVAHLTALLDAAQPRRAFMVDVIRWRLPKELPELQRRYPHGVTAKHVAEHFGYPMPTVQVGIQRLVAAGKLRRHKMPRQVITILLRPGDPVPTERSLTARQRAVLDGLIRLSTDGRLEMSQSKLALHLGMDAHVIYHALQALIIEGKVKVLKRGANRKPSAYFIPSAIQVAA